MPKMVSEIPLGFSYERTSEAGVLSDTAVRKWRLLLNFQNEGFYFADPPPNGPGVKIGDPYSAANPIPCVSLTAEADGENKLTRIITARYASTPGTPLETNGDPGNDDPDQRLAIVTVSTSMAETPSRTWYTVGSGGVANASREVAKNPAGDMYDTVAAFEPVSIVTVEQFDWPTDPTQYIQHIGKVNSNEATWRGLLIQKRTMLFRGLTIRPQTIFWGTTLYRGWQSSYEFAIRRNMQIVSDAGSPFTVPSACGWDLAVVQEGFNYLDGNVRKRATVQLPGSTETVPSAERVALNDDGTLRDVKTANPPVLVYRRGIYDEVDFSTAFAHLRLAPT